MTFVPGTRGHGELEVNRVDGQSAITSVSACSPLKILTPRSRGFSVSACLSSFGGGLVAGDETHVSISLGAAARCYLGTQASTKIYRNPAARPCGQSLSARLEADSFLALMPDPIQAFAGSAYRQNQQFHLAPGANLVLVDWLTSGRAARGERWAFTRLHSRNEVFWGDKHSVLDSLLLDPTQGPLGDAHRLGRFNCLALILIIGTALVPAAQGCLNEISTARVERGSNLLVSASPLSQGALLRLAGEEVGVVASEIRRRLQFVATWLGADPWSRKW
jgi:urease accessory protein